MSREVNTSVLKAVQVLEQLYVDGYEGKTDLEVMDATGIPLSTVFRILKSWEAAGWVVAVTVPGKRETVWRLSHKLAGIAHAYERHAVSRVQAVKNEYRNITGKELEA